VRDLVETVIGQVLAADARAKHAPPKHAPRPMRPSPAQPDRHEGPPGRDARLWKACTQFEAIFLQQMLSEMRKSVPKSGLLPTGFAEDVHAAMFDQAVAEAGARRGMLGIAENLYRQLSARSGTHEMPEDADKKTGSVNPEADHAH